MLVRKELFEKKQCFNGTFDTDCQRSTVPDLLLALVNMILEGPSVMNKNEQDTVMGTNTGVALSQLLIFNAVKHHRVLQSDGTAVRHDPNREPPLPVYLGLLVHAETKKTLVDKFYRLGMSISYDRVMQISADLGTYSVCAV